jgi:hypothetical protein
MEVGRGIDLGVGDIECHRKLLRLNKDTPCHLDKGTAISVAQNILAV